MTIFSMWAQPPAGSYLKVSEPQFSLTSMESNVD